MLENSLDKFIWCFSLCILTICLLTACSENESNKETHKAKEPSAIESNTEVTIDLKLASSKTVKFISVIDQYFLKLLNEAKKLNEYLLAFTQQPTDEKLSNSIDKLNDTHSLFSKWHSLILCCKSLQLAPNSSAQDANHQIDLMTRLDHHPLLPGYLDTVKDYPFSGLIYSDIPITVESMEKEFQLGDPAYVTLGFHALETILKGDDSQRKAEDFSVLKSTDDTESAPAALRRTLYAILLASEIRNDLVVFENQWISTKKKLLEMSNDDSNLFFNQLNMLIKQELEIVDSEKSDIQQNQDMKHDTADILHLRKEFLQQLISALNNGH